MTAFQLRVKRMIVNQLEKEKAEANELKEAHAALKDEHEFELNN